MSFGLLTAEHEGEEGANNWSDEGSGGRSPPGTLKAAPEVTKGAGPSRPQVLMSERNTAESQNTTFLRCCTSPEITFKQEQHSNKTSRSSPPRRSRKSL